jgi:hypothetical protein
MILYKDKQEDKYMNITRRGFLGLLLGAGAAAMAQANPITRILQESSNTDPKKKPATPEELLVESFFPALKLNEGEKFYFYLCSAKKVTVGYGTNTEDNPNALTNVSIFCDKKPLTAAERTVFFQKMEQNPGKEWRKLKEEKQKLEKEKEE